MGPGSGLRAPGSGLRGPTFLPLPPASHPAGACSRFVPQLSLLHEDRPGYSVPHSVHVTRSRFAGDSQAASAIGRATDVAVTTARLMIAIAVSIGTGVAYSGMIAIRARDASQVRPIPRKIPTPTGGMMDPSKPLHSLDGSAPRADRIPNDSRYRAATIPARPKRPAAARPRAATAYHPKTIAPKRSPERAAEVS